MEMKVLLLILLLFTLQLYTVDAQEDDRRAGRMTENEIDPNVGEGHGNDMMSRLNSSHCRPYCFINITI